MATFPDYPIAADKSNLTPQSDDHPEHHNALARAVNHLQGQIDTAITTAQIVPGTLAAVDFANTSVTAPKLAPSAKSPLSYRVAGGTYVVGSTETTICTLILPGQPLAGEWLVNGFISAPVASATPGDMFAMRIREIDLTILSDASLEAKLGRSTDSTQVWLQVPANTAKTLILTLQRWSGSTATVTTVSSMAYSRFEAKFFPT